MTGRSMPRLGNSEESLMSGGKQRATGQLSLAAGKLPEGRVSIKSLTAD
jgi:hypothetical protein